MPAIEIDQDILDYLKRQVRDFNESPSTVLRRELRLEPLKGPPPAPLPRRNEPRAPVEGMPLDSPEALRQIMRVLRLVRADGLPRVQATVRTAEEFGVTRETVGDKYGRQLGLTTAEFDHYLGEKDLAQLQRVLLSKFPAQKLPIISAVQGILATERI